MAAAGAAVAEVPPRPPSQTAAVEVPAGEAAENELQPHWLQEAVVAVPVVGAAMALEVGVLHLVEAEAPAAAAGL